MKHVLTWLVCALGLMWSAAHAEPVRKAVSSKAVDLEAAAKATAALYASMATAPSVAAVPAAAVVAPAPVPAPVPAPLWPTRPLSSVPSTPRSSPLLPPAAEPLAPAVAASQAAGEVWAGAYHCEHAEKVSLRPGLASDQVELQWKAQRWQLRRMDSRSGAMRLEDASARMVWIQLPNKSMLLDQRLGRRLLDECQHDVQVQTAAQMKTNPPPALFDTTGMGR